jgi:N-methylhydantoinase A
LRADVLTDLVADGMPTSQCRVRLEADLRFDRQGSELTVPVEVTDHDRPRIDELEAHFKSEYARRFGQGAIAMGVPVELVTLRAIGRAIEAKVAATTETGPGSSSTRTTAASRTRPLRFERHGGATEVPVYDRPAIGAGAVVEGPALVDAGDTTIWIRRGYRGRPDARGALILEAGIPAQEAAS